MTKFEYNLVIIGGGSGGLAAAEIASRLGLKSVALVESKTLLGGECLHTGCVPSKALLHAADEYFKVVNSGGTMSKSFAWDMVSASIEYIKNRSDNDKYFQSRGISVIHSNAKFKDKHTLLLNSGKILSSRYFLISTGSSPRLPNIEGLKTSSYSTNETIFDLKVTPESLIIIGGGPIGCEMATAFSKLGCRVSIVQNTDRLLAREEQEASQIVLNNLTKLGVNVYFNTKTIKVSQENSKSKLFIEVDGKQKILSADKLLVAAGRKPNLDLDLKNATIKYDERRGITTNKYLQTSVNNIYAVGDCTTSPKFTHLAASQASLAERNMIIPWYKKSSKYMTTVPWITFTSPDIGRLGMTEEEARKSGSLNRVIRLNINEIDRAVTNQSPNGYCKVLLDKRERIIGATIASQNASELLTPLCLLYYQGRRFNDLYKTILPYPTLSSGLNILALNSVAQGLSTSKAWRLIANRWL